MRYFLALIPENKSIEKLGNLSSYNAKIIPNAKSIKKHNLHLTLKFFKDIKKEQVDLLAKWIKYVKVENCIKFLCNYSGFFPSIDNPKVFWIGQNSEHSEINYLYRSIEEYCDINTIEEKGIRPFTPHVTINRIKSNKEDKKDYKIFFENEPFEIIFRNLALVESTLTPNGAKHEIICYKEL